ncbi:MAG: hypothetical protein IT308_08925 [Anaerolineaceae bacterium]|nr:hypothetical protein [Anaerolineaceae bacterium]
MPWQTLPAGFIFYSGANGESPRKFGVLAWRTRLTPHFLPMTLRLFEKWWGNAEDLRIT